MKPKTIAFDFDQTIAIYTSTYWKTKYVVKVPVRATPNHKVVELIRQLKEQGNTVVVYTSRWWGDYHTITKWMTKHKIPFDDLVCGRFKADCYICDKSLNPSDPALTNKCFDMIRMGK